MRARLAERTVPPMDNEAAPAATPLVLHREPVRAEWLDYNEHMNVAYYVLVFDHATDAMCNHIGIGHDYMRDTGGSIFILESHVSYLREVVRDDLLRFATHIFDYDSKRIHFAHEMYHDEAGYLAATNELMMLHVDLNTRRTAPMPDAVLEKLATLKAGHATLARPTGLSRAMGLTAGKNQ